MCANRQDLYWDYAHWVYANQDGENAGGFRPERLRSIAEAAGVDVTDWDACVSDAAVRQQVADSTATGHRPGRQLDADDVPQRSPHRAARPRSAEELGIADRGGGRSRGLVRRAVRDRQRRAVTVPRGARTIVGVELRG